MNLSGQNLFPKQYLHAFKDFEQSLYQCLQAFMDLEQSLYQCLHAFLVKMLKMKETIHRYRTAISSRLKMKVSKMML